MDPYKRRQMEFEDREWPRYNLQPAVLPPAYRAYVEHQCEVGALDLARIGLGDLRSLLICGVGGGADLEFWLQRWQAARFVAMDFSIEAIRATQRRLIHQGVSRPIEYIKGDMEEIPLAANSLDVVIACQVLHHASNPAQACREIFRVARRGVLLLEPARTLSTPLLQRIGLAQTTEVVGNTVLRFKKGDFASYLNGGNYRMRYRRYFFYDHRLIERWLSHGLKFPAAGRMVGSLCRWADVCLLPLRSKCSVVIRKLSSDLA